MRKLSKYLFFFIGILATLYLAFPVWSSWILLKRLPANISLISFKPDYPGLRHILIPELQFTTGEAKIFITDMQLEYDLTDFKINTIFFNKIEIVQAKSTTNENNNLLRLPEINTADFESINALIPVQIHQLEISSGQNKVHLSGINLNKLEENKFLLKAEVDKSQYLNNKPLSISSILLFNTNQIDVEINAFDKKLLNLKYIFDDQSKQLISSFDINKIKAISVFDNFNLPFKSEGLTTVDWKEETSTNKVNLHIQSQLIPVVSQQENNKIVLKRLDDNNQSIQFPVNLFITSTTEQFPLFSKLKFETTSQSHLQLVSDDFSIDSKAFDLKLNTDISIENINDTEPQISLSDISTTLTSDNFNVRANDIPLIMEQFNFAANIEDIKSPLIKFIDSQWKLSALASIDKLSVNHVLDGEPVEIESPAEIKFDLFNEQQIFSDGQLNLSQLKLSHQNSAIDGHLSINWKAVDSLFSSGHFTALLTSDKSQILNQSVESISINSDVDLFEEQIKGKGQFVINQQLLTPYSFRLEKASSRLNIEFETNKIANQLLNQFIIPFGKENNIPLRIAAGEVIHSGDISLSDNILLGSQFAIRDMLFKFGENSIQGMSVEQEILAINPLQMQSSLKIDSVDFSSGLELKNLSASLASSENRFLSINSLSSELLSGKLTADSIHLTKDGIEPSLVKLNNISLTDLIFFLDIPGLYAEGEMEFTLPIDIASGSLIIDKGTFAASKNGIIKYTNGQTELDNDDNIALKALENFHYKSLDGELSYNEKGLYKIKLHLLGSNPDLYDGYPVDFILNLKGELSGVFRSLFLTGSFEQAVMEQVKSSELEQ